MKKTILFFTAAILILSIIPNTTVSAEAGDVIHTIYSTDILTYMDGIPIQGYNIDGKTMICLEDLENYGFSVCYSDEARALFVNKHEAADYGFEPDIVRGTTGAIAGYTYKTDILAYVNGHEIAAENIGGKLAVCAEDLANMNASSTIRNLGFDYPAFFMQYAYHDSSRSLYLVSNITDNDIYNTNISDFTAGISKSNGLFTITDEFENGSYSQYVVKGIYRDTANFDGCNAVRFYKNGITFNAENALREYDFIAHVMKDGISITDMSFSADGRYLCFSGERSKAYPNSLMGSREVYESGEYMLDMDTFALIKVKVQKYDLPQELQ